MLSPVVCALDLAPESEPALVAAVELAARTDLPLHLVTARPAPEPDAYRAPADPEAAVRAVVELAVDRALGAGACAEIAPEIAVARGDDPAAEIVAYARRVDAGSLVLGTHGRRGLQRFQLGSVAEDVIRESPCPVLVVPNASASRTPGPDHPVLFATDLSAASAAALPAARALAELYGAPLEAVTVGGALEPVGVAVEAAARALPDAPDLAPTIERVAALDEGTRFAAIHVLAGDAAAEVVALAEARSAGAVVMGTHGRRGVRRALFGSVTAAVLRQLTCPVLAVRA